jgi:type I restriction enzyme S subunit
MDGGGGGVKAGWQSKPLVVVCQIKPPKAEARKRLSGKQLVSFVPMENLGIDQKILVPAQTRTLDEVAGSYTYFADGDVLLAKITPCFENGKLGIADKLTNGIGFGSSEYIVFRPSPAVDKEWLYYFLSRQLFREEGAERMSGAVGHKRVSKEFIESTQIPVPSLPEQHRIVTILDKAFDGIATAKANAEENLQNARALFESHLQSVFTERGEGWVERTLGELGTITSSKRIFKSEYVKSGVPFYRTKEIKELANGNEITTELFISETRYKEIKSGFGVPTEGDIFLTAIGTIGEIWVVEGDNDFYFKDGNVLWLKNFTSINPHFLKYVLLSFVESLNKMSHGSAYSALPIQRLNAHRIFLPSPAEQEQIIETLDALREETQHLESLYRQKLAALDPTLTLSRHISDRPPVTARVGGR